MEVLMDQTPVAARFVAFAFYLNGGKDGPLSPRQAGRLARKNWKQFLPHTSEDLVRFLTSEGSSADKHARRRPPAKRELVGAC